VREKALAAEQAAVRERQEAVARRETQVVAAMREVDERQEGLLRDHQDKVTIFGGPGVGAAPSCQGAAAAVCGGGGSALARILSLSLSLSLSRTHTHTHGDITLAL
jgi:hypothetical protein